MAKIKPALRAPKKYIDIPVKLKQSSGGPIVLEGFANKAVVDRGNDLIPGDAWKLDDFQLVPMILFNHDRDFPIGKATKIEKTPEGLRIRAQLSQSDAPQMKFVRDLVKEGILKAFSVGFDPIEEETDDKGVNVIKSADLLEVSVVTLPMNQASVFDVTSKDLKRLSYGEVKTKALASQGNWVAAEINKKICELDKDKNFCKYEAIKDIIDIADITEKRLNDILIGKSKSIPEPLLEAFASVLGLDLEVLKELNNRGMPSDDDQEKPEQGKTEDDEAQDLEDDAASSSEDHDPESIPPQPTKADDDDKEENENEDETNDDKEDHDEEDESKDNKESENTKLEGEDFRDCVSGKIPKLLEEGMEQDQAVAVAMEQCREKSDGVCELKSNDIAQLLEYADAIKSGDASDWDSFIALTATSKQAEQDDVMPVTVPISTDAVKDETDTGNPHLDLAKQTNVLLGTLINEMQQLRNAVSGLVVKQPEDETEELEIIDDKVEVVDDLDDEEEKFGHDDEDSETEQSDDEDEKALEEISIFIKNLDKRLKKYE